MSKHWELFLDESGSFSDEKRYFILAGVLIDSDHFYHVSEETSKLINDVCSLLDASEIHAKELSPRKREYARNIVFYNVGKMKNLKIVVYIIDLEKTYVIDRYDKLSFKYNKAIELFYHDLIIYNIISENDYLSIYFDYFTFSNSEKHNIKNWLKNNIGQIKDFDMIDSKANKFIQIADLVANFFSKTGGQDTNSANFIALNPFYEVFPRKFKDDYLKK